MRLQQEREKPGRATSAVRDTLAVLADPAAWLTAAIFFLTNMAYSSLPVFMPTILRAMGHDALSAQALSAPPYLVSFFVVLATAYASDVMRARSPLLIIRMSNPDSIPFARPGCLVEGGGATPLPTFYSHLSTPNT
jgi:hypothetical protein